MPRKKGVQPDVWSKRRTAGHFRPMLAFPFPHHKPIPYPIYLSPKLDGIRCVIRKDVALSRKLKPIPNHAIREYLSRPEFNGLDGELIVGHPCANDVWNQTTSGVMRQEGEPAWAFYVFDDTTARGGFHDRYEALCKRMHERPDPRIIIVPHHLVHNVDELSEQEALIVGMGYEGVMLRKFQGIYKFGRSSTNDMALMKLKRFVDADAYVIGVVERMHNANEATIDALGLTQHSSHKENMIPTGTMGALVCNFVPAEDELANKFVPVKFELGTGFTEEQRVEMWRNPPVGKLIKFKFQRLTVHGKPLFPVFLGFRHEWDRS